MRPFVIAANWKMYKSPSEAVDYFKNFLPTIAPIQAELENGLRQVIFFVPAIDLWVTQMALRQTGITWGGQNAHFEKQGAFTGENSPQVLAEIGTPFCLVGHSERRTLFRETDEDTARKVEALHACGITPMLCVGETLEEREAGKTGEVIQRQIKIGLAKRDPSKALQIAYEPVWAIGTGRVATPAQANEAHSVLRKSLVEIGGAALAQVTPILYGGSVKPENSAELASQNEIDGFLVGGASLQVASFQSLALVHLPG
jgi:triosephosphate isomerase